MERKLLFFDIDGTLAMPGNPPTPAVVSAIRAARNNGHLAFISTGRPQWLVDPAITDIGFDGGLYHAGGRAVVGDQVLLDHCMPPEMVSSMVNLFRKEKGLYFLLECADCCYRNDPEPFLDAAGKINGGSSELRRVMQTLLDPDHRSERDYAGDRVYKISYFTSTKPQMEHLTAQLQKLGGKAIYFENIAPSAALCSGEVTAYGIDKGVALGAICQHFHTDSHSAIAFGDSINDIEIITAAGLGIAMGNAEERLKKVADTVCESVDADGVALALARLGLTANH